MGLHMETTSVGNLMWLSQFQLKLQQQQRETQILFHTETYLKSQRKKGRILEQYLLLCLELGPHADLKKSSFNWKRFNRVSGKQKELNFKQYF